jgi:hypothetical protein
MIVLVSEVRHSATAREIASALSEAFPGFPLTIADAESPRWSAAFTWSDVLVVPFDGAPFSPEIEAFVATQLVRAPRPFVLPVAVGGHRAPPGPLAAVKALPVVGPAFENGCDRIGAMLGLRIRSRDHTVFISYRAMDGSAAAEQLEAFLRENGYHVWRDDSKDQFDGQTMIPPGKEVQAEIENNLKTADLLLLIDSPRAAESHWINLEVNLANGNLIPVLPILLRLPEERVFCSRFRALDTLQRGIAFDLAADAPPARLTVEQLKLTLSEMESYLKAMFQRRLRLPHHVREEFEAHAYQWSERDRFIFEAIRQAGGKVRRRIFSHCSVFDGIYDPALRAFVVHLRGLDPRANYALFVYDGPLIPAVQLREIERAAQLQDAADVILLHHQELRTLLQNEFVQ